MVNMVGGPKLLMTVCWFGSSVSHQIAGSRVGNDTSWCGCAYTPIPTNPPGYIRMHVDWIGRVLKRVALIPKPVYQTGLVAPFQYAHTGVSNQTRAWNTASSHQMIPNPANSIPKFEMLSTCVTVLNDTGSVSNGSLPAWAHMHTYAHMRSHSRFTNESVSQLLNHIYFAFSCFDTKGPNPFSIPSGGSTVTLNSHLIQSIKKCYVSVRN
jgi:hypothetical protein